ncbi:MAG: DUF983 domain-containing protein [Beijerinckiaceae bacterium]|nr:DUF983 domain-containing protein [Beijerinckiaceae bacterium]MDO9442595.1 DUF983 domain-containing protein [Beijerinckiaceae bacterium]
MSHHDDLYPPQSPYHTGMRGLCPRCGQGRLFTGFINVAPKCEVCGLDFAFADAGDGPAVFVTLLAGFVVMGLALWTVVVYEPPMWLFMLIFLPLALFVSLGMLRPLKGLLVSLQYRNKAEQGRLSE